MARLELALLGPPLICLDGQPAEGFTFQKVRALLIFLAMEQRREHAREALVGLLWPDQPETTSRTNLRQALATLREAIDDANAVPPFLSVHRDTVRFELGESDWLDVIEFQALLEGCAAHNHRDPNRCRSCARRREKAVALYRGEFLSGFYVREAGAFDEWAAIHRERLHRKTVEAVGRLAVFYEASGDLERAEAMVGRQLELDPWMEEAHRERMRLLAMVGRRSQALAQYEACRQILADELGVEPAAETSELDRQVRDGVFPARPEASQASQGVPHRASGLLGRERELEELIDLVEDADHRLVTITGAGGIGKTRLAEAVAFEVATSFSGGAAWVPLASLVSRRQIAEAILACLGVPQNGVGDAEDRLWVALRDRECLLVLDGIEHLLPAGRELIVDLLKAAGKSAVLVTSQERLGLQAEWRYELSGLELPTAGDPVAAIGSGAVRLFLERARQVNRQIGSDSAGIEHVVRICRVVEGVPLAIELAASAVGVRTLEEIASDLEGDAASLASQHLDVPERHRSQAAAFDYSWDLLDGDRQADLSRLSVFRGGWDEQAARSVAGADPGALAALSDKSLIRRDRGGRYGFHPLLQRYADERLQQTGEVEAVRTAHLSYFEGYAKTAAEQAIGESQAEWLAKLDLDLANLRGALAWGLESGQLDVAADLCLSLARYWMIRGQMKEGQEWIEQVLAVHPGPASESRVKLLNRAGILAAMQRRFDEAERHLTASVDLGRTLGDVLGEVTSLNSLGAMSIEQGEYERAGGYLEACLPVWQQLEDKDGLAKTLNNLGAVALMQGHHAAAREWFGRSLPIFRELGDRRMIAGVLYNLGDLSLKEGKVSDARGHLGESLRLRAEIGDVGGVAEALEAFARLAVDEMQPRRAARLFGTAAAMREVAGTPLAPINQPDYDKALAEARRQLEARAFEVEWAEGMQLDVNAAVALALQA